MHACVRDTRVLYGEIIKKTGATKILIAPPSQTDSPKDAFIIFSLNIINV